MTTTRIRIDQAGPYVTFQDSGRTGHMRYGVSASGPMDSTSFKAANLAIGNEADATCIEVSLGGLVIECLSGEVTLSINGGEFGIELAVQPVKSNSVLTLSAGQTLAVQPGKVGSWCYVAFSGRLEVPQWLGRTATHALSGFGGGVLQPGQEFNITQCRTHPELEGPIMQFAQRKFGQHLRVVMGPQDQHFVGKATERFLNSEFTLSSAYDRMGVRLNGPKLELADSLSIPSEPVLKGSVQVSGDGIPTILLADHQTTGGYPKIATVVSADLDDFTQMRPRQKIRFHAIEPQDAIKLARVREIELRTYFDSISP